MRLILFLVAIIAVMAVIGWITFSGNGDRASMTIETERMQRDAEEAVETGREAFEGARRGIREGTDERRQPAPEDEPRRDTERDTGVDDAEPREPVNGSSAPAWRMPHEAPSVQSLRV